MAEQMMQMGVIKSPEEYIAVMNTGKLETMTEGQNKQLLLVKAENERLVDGTSQVTAVLTDAHSLHLREHSNVLADPDLRLDPELVQRTLNHIQEHINILSDPNVANILVSIGEQPMGPPGGTPNAPGSMDAEQPPQQSLGEMNELISNPQAQSVSTEQQAGPLPQPATPPAPFEDAPQSPQDLFARNSGQ